MANWPNWQEDHDSVEEYLNGIFVTCVENSYRWFNVVEYHNAYEDTSHDAYAHIQYKDESIEVDRRITIETIRRGLNVAKAKGVQYSGYAGDIDTIDALNILEYALFGRVVFV